MKRSLRFSSSAELLRCFATPGALLAACAGAARAQCLDWSPTFGNPGVAGSTATVFSMAEFDPDGAGPAAPSLIVGGSFTSVGGVAASRIARWNGSSWSSLGTGMNAGAIVYSLAVFDADGAGPGAPALYAGGSFVTAGGTPASNVARWNGTSWSAVGTGCNDVVFCLSIGGDGTLYAGGQFTTANGVAANRIARWSPGAPTWAPLGSGCDNTVYAITPPRLATGIDLFAGGTFVTAGGVTANRVARWNGTSWSALGSGVDGPAQVKALAYFDDDGGGPHVPELIVGGLFASVSGVPASNMARWDGSQWRALGTGTDDIVNALVVHDEGSGPGAAVYAGGQFTHAGSGSATCTARWDGSSWSSLGTGLGGSSPFVWTLRVHDDHTGWGADVVCGGRFTVAGGGPVGGLAQWRGCIPPSAREDLEAGATSPPAQPAATCCAGSTDRAESVQPFSGEMRMQVEDMRIPGLGFDFRLARNYRSKIGRSTPVGHGWTYSHDVRLEPSGSNLIVVDGAGRRDLYTLQAGGGWTRAEQFRRIILDAGGYTLRFADGGTWHFLPLTHPTLAGRLDTSIDRNGNSAVLSYDAQGRLMLVRDALSTAALPRSIVLAYDAGGQLASVTDWLGRRTSYAYYQAGDAGGSPGDLKSATTPAITATADFPLPADAGHLWPFGKTTTYSYTRGFRDERLNHNLLAITDAKGQTSLINEYAATQDPSDLEFDRIVRQTVGQSGEDIKYSYSHETPSAANGFAVRRTVINDRVGNVRELFYDTGNRLVVQREFTGRADPALPTTVSANRPTNRLRASDPAWFETRWTYNADSLAVSIEMPNGNVVENVYELDLDPLAEPATRGNLRERRRLPGSHMPAGDQAQIVEYFEYDVGGGCCGGNYLKSHTDPRGFTTTYVNDAAGNRLHAQHPIAAMVEDWTYDAQGRVISHTLPENGSGYRRRDEFEYYGPADGAQNGSLRREIIDAATLALTTTHEYDAVGNRRRSIDPRGFDTRRIVNQLGQAVREESAETSIGSGIRHARELFYDGNDNLIRVEIENRDENGALAVNASFTTTCTFDVLDHLVARTREVDGGSSVTETCEYDANRNITRVLKGSAVDGSQPANTAGMSYDERDLPWRFVRAQGSPQESTSEFSYDANGNITATREGLESSPRATQLLYDGYDRLWSRFDPMANEYDYHYDAAGNEVRNVVFGQLVDDAGSASNVRLGETRKTYDAAGRLVADETAHFEVSSGNPIGDGWSTLTYVHNPLGSVTRMVDDNGHAVDIVHDTVARESIQTDAKQNQVVSSYDAGSNVIAVEERERADGGGALQVFRSLIDYDGLGRAVRVVDSRGTVETRRYDSRDNVVAARDGNGVETRLAYDGLSRVRAATVDMNANGAAESDPADLTTRQAWDASSRLVARTDGMGNASTYTYDALDRLVAEVFADGTQRTVTYDVHDDEVLAQDANGTTTVSTYDGLDRLVHRAITTGPGVALDTTFENYAYDGMSRVGSLQDDDSLVVREYESIGTVRREIANGRVLTHVHDGAGNALSASYGGGFDVATIYDALNHKRALSATTGPSAAFDYVGPTRELGRRYGNGTRVRLEYDGMIGATPAPGDFGVKHIIRTLHETSSGVKFADHRYAWDRVGNKTQRVDARGTSVVQSFGYDAANRMIRSNRTGDEPVQYRFDAANNRQGRGYELLAGMPEPADRQVNQYTRTPRTFAGPFSAPLSTPAPRVDSRSYDKNGNLVAIVPEPSVGGVGGPAASTSIQYDYRDQMVGHTRGGVHTHYRYDALGRRIEKDVAGAKTTYQHDDWRVVAEFSGAAAVPTSTYVYGAELDDPVAMTRNGQHFYFHADDQANVVAVSDAAGAVVERYDYLDFGVTLVQAPDGTPRSSSAIGNHVRYNGQWFDEESGLYCFRTRYLEPEVGRFTTRDSIGTWGDETNRGNAFTFVANNPWTGNDPLGTGWLKKVVKAVTQVVTNVVNKVVNTVGNTGLGKAIKKFVDAAKDGWKKAKSWFQTAKTKLQAWAKKTKAKAVQFLRDVGEFFVNVARVVVAIVTLPSRIAAWVMASAVNLVSPSFRYGNWCGSGTRGNQVNPPIIDPLDDCCKTHDGCATTISVFVACSASVRECNRNLCECAKSVDCEASYPMGTVPVGTINVPWAGQALRECRAFQSHIQTFFCRSFI